MRIRLLIGLPGSGKTTLAKEWQAQDPNITILDDPHSRLLPDAEDLVIIDPNLCLAKTRVSAIDFLRRRYAGCSIEEIYYEKDVAQCRANVKHRNDGRNVEGTLVLMDRLYTPPDNTPLLPVWRPGTI